jgi:carboxynorspermidine decarboxylase
MKINEIPTPAYVIDEGKLKKNLEILKDVQDRSGAKILLAQKAFSAYQTYPLIAEYLTGACASGLYEARLAHEEFKTRLGERKENHVFEPAFRDSEMDEVCRICDHVVFNSIDQLEHHRAVWEKYVSEGTLSVGLRINPDISADDVLEIYDPCGPGSRLGIRNEYMPEELPKGVEGIHFHNLCEQGFEPLEETFLKVERDFWRFFPMPRIPDDYDSYVFRVMEFDESKGRYDEEVALDNIPVETEDLDAELGLTGSENKIKWINLGGGHHITRDDYDRDALINLVRYIREKYGIEVYMEPGEAIALDAGYMATTVMDVVQTERMPVLILDCSASCHMPDVIEMPYRPPLKDSEEPGEMNYTYRLSSMTCLAGDIIGDYSFDDEKKPGDRLYFEDMAIYSFVKNNTFNGMPLPDLCLMHEDGEAEVLRHFDYTDFKSRL